VGVEANWALRAETAAADGMMMTAPMAMTYEIAAKDSRRGLSFVPLSAAYGYSSTERLAR
jgi:hypothetical protein